MISTFHCTNYLETNKRTRAGDPITKQNFIANYNKVKGGIDLSDRMIEYYSPARKSVKWYRKVVFQLLSITMLNSSIIYNTYYNKSSKLRLQDFTKSVVLAYLASQTWKPRKFRERCMNCRRYLGKKMA